MRRLVVWIAIAGVGGLLLPATAGAQGGSISGQVEDTTGGILPGVTVEADSPVNIEGTITAFTDGAGRYTIINLRPGTYTITFTLPGFNTFVREGDRASSATRPSRSNARHGGRSARGDGDGHGRIAARRRAAGSPPVRGDAGR